MCSMLFCPALDASVAVMESGTCPTNGISWNFASSLASSQIACGYTTPLVIPPFMTMSQVRVGEPYSAAARSSLMA